MTEIQDVGQLYPDQALRANDGKNSEDNEFKVNPTHWEKAPFSLVICGIGNFLVWYDFNLIAFFADDLGDAFFPDEIALMTQPIGGILLGYIADRYGRRLSLQVSILGMALSTFIIGIIPVYATIGNWCIGIFVLSRVVQGICAGGEYGTVLVYITEIAPDTSLGKYIGLLFASASGALLSLVAYLICEVVFTDPAIHDYIWRVPFACSIVLGAIGVCMRRKMHESDVWQRFEDQERIISNPFEKYLWQSNYFVVNFLVIFFASIVLQPIYFLNLIWLPSYFESDASNVKNPYAYDVTIASFIVLIGTVIFFGYLSDRTRLFDLPNQLGIFTAITFIGFPLIYSLSFYSVNYGVISVLMIILAFITALDTAPFLIYVSTYIDEPLIAASILSFGMAASNAIFAGTIDDIADAITDKLGYDNYLSGLYIGLYLDLLLIISYIGTSIGTSIKRDDVLFGTSDDIVNQFPAHSTGTNKYGNENENEDEDGVDEETPLNFKAHKESFVDEVEHRRTMSQMESNLEQL